MPTLKECYQCGKENPEQGFCGACGSPLGFGEYISKKVKDQLAETIKDRDVLEMDSSIKVFTRAMGWMKLIFGIAVGLLVVTGVNIWWKASDFESGVDKAKQSVIDTAKKSSDEMARSSSQSKQEISSALQAGKAAIATASGDAVRQSEALKDTTLKTKAEISKQTAAFQDDIEGSRQQLQAANKMGPEIEGMRKQLAQATSDIEAQQKVISSSQAFVKSVFSSHIVDYFHVGQPPKERYAVIPPPSGGNRTVVFLLLESVPIPETLQVQYHIYTQPQNSYFTLKNLVIFFWADPVENLKAQQLSVAYFPDKSGQGHNSRALRTRRSRVC
jgi:hypothetical protein